MRGGQQDRLWRGVRGAELQKGHRSPHAILEVFDVENFVFARTARCRDLGDVAGVLSD
jgi:hypothetical protein